MLTSQHPTFKVRLWMAALLAWLVVFYNIERLHAPLNIASFVYVLAGGLAIALVSFEALTGLPWAVFWGGSLAVLLIAKAALGYPLGGSNLPLTVTEAVAVTVTIVLAQRVSAAWHPAAAPDLLTPHLGARPSTFDAGQAALYREIRRARRFGRPLALVSVAAKGRVGGESLDRLLEQLRREVIERYLNARLAELLAGHTGDCDLVADCGDHFVVLLPEMDREGAAEAVERIRTAAEEQLGVDLRIGLSSFPDEEVTFSGLLEQAQGEMRSQPLERNGNRSVALSNSDGV